MFETYAEALFRLVLSSASCPGSLERGSTEKYATEASDLLFQTDKEIFDTFRKAKEKAYEKFYQARSTTYETLMYNLRVLIEDHIDAVKNTVQA